MLFRAASESLDVCREAEKGDEKDFPHLNSAVCTSDSVGLALSEHSKKLIDMVNTGLHQKNVNNHYMFTCWGLYTV